MYAHSLLWHYLWLAPTVLLVVGAIAMLRRGLHRDYPMFFLYAIWQILFTPLLFVLDHVSAITIQQYQLFSWIGEAGSLVLRFAVIYEISAVLFRPYRTLKPLVDIVMNLGLIGLLVASVTVARLSPSASYADWIVGTLFLLLRAVAIIQCGLLIFVFVLSWYFNLSWRSYIFGIAIGFGVLSATQIVTSSLRAEAAQSESMNFMTMGAYHVCALIWAIYLLIPERAAASVKSVPGPDLESWNRELERLLQR